MRLAIVNHEYPPLAGGASTASAEIAGQWAALGHEVLVVTSAAPETAGHELKGGVSVVRVPGRRRSLSSPSLTELIGASSSLAWHLPGLLRGFRPDGVLAFFAIPSGWLAVRAGRRLDVPVIVSLRGSDVPGFPGRRLPSWSRPVARQLVRTALRGADLVAPNCEELHRLAVALLPEVQDKSLVIGNGLAESWLATEPAGSGSSELQIVTVGQLIARKRIELALAAMRHLVDAGIPARLTVIGDGPLRQSLQKQAAELALSAAVDFLGYQTRAQVRQQLRKHDVFLFASAGEGMSNAVLEAMGSGLPIVTTRDACHDWVTSVGCGESVPAEDPAAMAAALARLHRAEGTRKERAEAGIRYARTCTWRRTAERFADAFQQLNEATSPLA
jgi:glycosyltransferase involved in cell wall biosynthesis